MILNVYLKYQVFLDYLDWISVFTYGISATRGLSFNTSCTKDVIQ